ncbi:hypothetical protein CCP3SC1AL1_2710004 [Gammaproteobacteria bacterium]
MTEKSGVIVAPSVKTVIVPRCAAVNVCTILSPATVALVAGNVIVVASVPAKVSELLAVNVLPSAIVSVDAVAGAVKATLLIDVAVATPNTGVTKVGVFDKTTATVPVDDVTPVPPEATGRAEPKVKELK